MDVVGFIDSHREEHGVEPICRTLCEADVPVAPSTYYAHKSRPPSTRARADAALDERIIAVHAENNAVYGARKVWKALNRQPGHPRVARCTVERRMRALELRGVPSERTTRTTRPKKSDTRPGDLLHRDFTAPAPNRRWVADITYVAT